MIPEFQKSFWMQDSGILIQQFLSLVAKWIYFRLQMNSADTSLLRRKDATRVIR